MVTSTGSGRSVVLALVACTTSAADGATYTLTDLGTLNGYSDSRALGINDAGDIVGLATNDLLLGPHRAFRWRSGLITDLGTLGGAGSTATAVSELGVVVGLADTQAGASPPFRAFSWQSPPMLDLGTLGGSSSWAESINSVGAIVGGARVNGDAVYYPAIWSGGPPQPLALLQNHWVGAARAVNNAGQVVGYSTSLFSQARAVLWDDGPQDLGTLPAGCCSEAFDINDQGTIVGLSWINGTAAYHAAVWSGGTPDDLGTLLGGTRSQAYAINDAGEVVGMSWTSSQPPGSPHACIWRGGAPTDLNSVLDGPSDWTLTEARDINNLGWIAATGVNTRSGTTHAILLVPVGALPGDYDRDGDVDLDDFAEFPPCMAGPGVDPPLAACAVFDFESDNDVDLVDFGGFCQRFTGT